MPDLRQAVSNLIDAGYSDDDIKAVVGQVREQTAKYVDQGLQDSEIEKRIGASTFIKDGKPLPLFKSISTQDDYTMDVKVGSDVKRRPEGFFGTLSDATSSGVKTIQSAFNPQPTGSPTMDVIQKQPAFILGKAALGALEIFGAVPTAAGQKVGELAQDASMAMGASPNVSAGIATAANIGTQMVGIPYAASKAAPYAMKGVQSMAKTMPGAQVALRSIGQKIVEAMPSALKPSVPSSQLYKMVEDLNPKVILPGFQAKAKEILKVESQLGEFGLANNQLSTAAGKAAKATSQTITPAGKWLGDEFGAELANAPREIPFTIVERIRRRLGERIGELRVSGGEELGSYKQLFRSLSKDLENAANPEAGAAYRYLDRANKAANREFAIGELDDVFNATIGRALEGQEFTSSNFAKALNKIRDLRRSDELFTKGIGAQNLDRIESQLDELRKLKINPSPKGANVGSYLMMRNAGVAGGIGTAIGALAGGPIGGIVGGGIGTAAGAGVPWVISRIMQTPSASARLVSILKKSGEVSPRQLQALAGLVAVNDTATRQFMEHFGDFMKDRQEPIEAKIQGAIERDRVQKTTATAERVSAEY